MCPMRKMRIDGGCGTFCIGCVLCALTFFILALFQFCKMFHTVYRMYKYIASLDGVSQLYL